MPCCYASDVFWTCEPEEYREKYLQPQLGLFETATTLEHIVKERGLRRERMRDMIFSSRTPTATGGRPSASLRIRVRPPNPSRHPGPIEDIHGGGRPLPGVG